MKVFLIGLGRAGCRVAHQFFASKEVNVDGALIDTDKADLSYLKYKYRILSGEGIIGGEGTGYDIGLGMEVMEADKYGIVDKITQLKGDVDCFFVVSALGGGTGGAVGPLIEELSKNVIEPIYYVGLLPSREDLPLATTNASKGLREAVKHCNAFFPIDLDRLKTTTRLKGNYEAVDKNIFRYLHPLFHIGDFRGKGDIGENTVDFSDLNKTLKGLTVIGLYRQNLSDELNSNKPDAVISLTQKAVEATTLSISLEDVQKALVAVLGDRKHIDFLGSIPARLWVEKNIGSKEVRGGDMPLNREGAVEVLVLLSDIKKSSEIASLYQKSSAPSVKAGTSKEILDVAEKIDNLKNKLAEVENGLDNEYKRLKDLAEE